jgi:hypothetical protein
MTHSKFTHLLTSIKALSAEQVQQLRQQIDSQVAQPKNMPVQSSIRGAKRTKAAKAPTKPPSIKELHRKMMARGLITRLPDPSLDIDDDDPADQPVPIKGEPLSETIIRERR